MIPAPLRALQATQPLIIAHRGAHGGILERENKLSAFQQAIKLGVDMVECDVHLSADNQVVVIHDETLERTTLGQGPVNAYTAAELRRWGVPTLARLCRLVRGKVRLLIEIKSASPYRVLEVIRTEKMKRQVVVFSFQPEYLQPIARLQPDIPLALLLDQFNDRIPNLARCIAQCRELNAVALAPSVTLCTDELVRTARQAGLGLLVWTANRPTQQRELITRNVDGIITDFPDRLKSLM